MTNPEQQQVSFEKLSRNATLAVLSRLAMLTCSTLGPIIAGWLVTRILDTQDKQAVALTAVAQAVALQTQRLDQVVNTDLALIRTVQGDHEARLRTLERGTVR